MPEILFKPFLDKIKERLADSDVLRIGSDEFPAGFFDTFAPEPLDGPKPVEDPLEPRVPSSLDKWAATAGLSAKFDDYGAVLFVEKLPKS